MEYVSCQESMSNIKAQSPNKIQMTQRFFDIYAFVIIWDLIFELKGVSNNG